jgi:hypothetical protein
MGLNLNGSGLPEPYAVNSVGNGQLGLVDERPLSFGALPDSFRKTVQSSATKESLLVRIKNTFSDVFTSLKASIGLSTPKNGLPPPSPNTGWGQATFWGIGTVLLGGLALGIFHGKIPVKSWIDSIQDRFKTLGSKNTPSSPASKTKEVASQLPSVEPHPSNASVHVVDAEAVRAAEAAAQAIRDAEAEVQAVRALGPEALAIREAEDVKNGMHTLIITPSGEHHVAIKLRPAANKSVFIGKEPILQNASHKVRLGEIIQIDNRLYKVTPEKTLYKVSDDALLIQELFPNGLNNIHFEQGRIGDCVKLTQTQAMLEDPSGMGTAAVLNQIRRGPGNSYIVDFVIDGHFILKSRRISQNAQGHKSLVHNNPREHLRGVNNVEIIPVSGDLGIQLLERAYYKHMRRDYLVHNSNSSSTKINGIIPCNVNIFRLK